MIFEQRSLLIDWLLDNNYLIKRFCYFIFMSTIREKINGQTAKNGVVLDTTSNVQPI